MLTLGHSPCVKQTCGIHSRHLTFTQLRCCTLLHSWINASPPLLQTYYCFKPFLCWLDLYDIQLVPQKSKPWCVLLLENASLSTWIYLCCLLKCQSSAPINEFCSTRRHRKVCNLSPTRLREPENGEHLSKMVGLNINIFLFNFLA